mmetsp:Transcript_17120/g.44588  ORF Transcript_17120/g.44588 Transcript_17120/m.44588 type:complete len:217 (+) Transcript_17120:3333-3983(+)
MLGILPGRGLTHVRLPRAVPFRCGATLKSGCAVGVGGWVMQGRRRKGAGNSGVGGERQRLKVADAGEVGLDDVICAAVGAKGVVHIIRVDERGVVKLRPGLLCGRPLPLGVVEKGGAHQNPHPDQRAQNDGSVVTSLRVGDHGGAPTVVARHWRKRGGGHCSRGHRGGLPAHRRRGRGHRHWRECHGGVGVRRQRWAAHHGGAGNWARHHPRGRRR